MSKRGGLVSAIRTLVADDDESWRHQVRLLFQARPEWHVICEVSDGAEVVRKAKELRPDLIVLDVGLSALNGIEATRRIRQLSPNSKIVFVSQDNSQDVVQVALGAGALGFVYKARAHSELLPAIDAVLQGKQFVTSMLKGYRFAQRPGTKAAHHHEVQFYSDDAVFLDRFSHFIAGALGAGDVAIVVATESHRDSLAQRLNAQGLDLDAALRCGTYIPLDVAKTLSTFMVNDMPDSNRFFEVVGNLIRVATKRGKTEHPRIAACGECAPLLWAEGKVDAAIRLERLWDEIATTYEVDILCGYALSNFRGEEDQDDFQSICAEHSSVYSEQRS
jgi:DNA-binding NarL/FixJ family response regulator